MSIIDVGDFARIPKILDKIADQTIWAGVVALTRVAVIARDEARKELDIKFTIRKNYVRTSIKHKAATRQSMEALVIDKDWYMAEQEYGAERTRAKSWYQIPAKDSGSADDNVRQIFGISNKTVIPKKFRAGSFLRAASEAKKTAGVTPFVLRLNANTSVIAIRQDGKFISLFVLKKGSVTIQKKPWFEDSTEKAYKDNINPVYDRTYEEVMAKIRL
jgi:hypothetical protein